MHGASGRTGLGNVTRVDSTDTFLQSIEALKSAEQARTERLARAELRAMELSLSRFPDMVREMDSEYTNATAKRQEQQMLLAKKQRASVDLFADDYTDTEENDKNNANTSSERSATFTFKMDKEANRLSGSEETRERLETHTAEETMSILSTKALREMHERVAAEERVLKNEAQKRVAQEENESRKMMKLKLEREEKDLLVQLRQQIAIKETCLRSELSTRIANEERERIEKMNRVVENETKKAESEIRMKKDEIRIVLSSEEERRRTEMVSRLRAAESQMLRDIEIEAAAARRKAEERQKEKEKALDEEFQRKRAEREEEEKRQNSTFIADLEKRSKELISTANNEKNAAIREREALEIEKRMTKEEKEALKAEKERLELLASELEKAKERQDDIIRAEATKVIEEHDKKEKERRETEAAELSKKFTEEHDQLALKLQACEAEKKNIQQKLDQLAEDHEAEIKTIKKKSRR